jgi:hypothetical protein
MFFVKYDPSGNALWAKSAGGNSDDRAYSVSSDGNGNIIISGYFQSSSITFGTTTLTNANAGSSDMFFIKYDPNGNAIWAKSHGGIGDENGRSLDTDSNGNILVTGGFSSSSITFGTTTLNNIDSLSSDFFLVKLDGVTGIEENNFTNTIDIFPNPFSLLTTLQADNPLHNATLTVDNCFGQTVAQIENINGQTVVLSRDNLATGLYFARLTQDNQVIATKKIIITD